METVTSGWRFVHIGFEGDRIAMGGVSLWDADWGHSTGKIVVAHPQHPNQRHAASIYRLASQGGEVEFAAGEFSNGVWGFVERLPDGV